MGHPCVETGTAEGALNLFRTVRDPTHGSPYDRCFAFGEAAYIRMGYPSLSDLLKNPLQAEVNAMLRLGFSTLIPLAFQRKIKLQTSLVKV